MKNIKILFYKHKDIILYGIFGVLTTAINYGSYKLCYDIIEMPNVISTVIAWVFSVAFAFITNKYWVFGSKSFKKNIFLKELFSFFGARLLTGLLDIAIMFISVDLLKQNSDLWKLLTNVIVIILNYILSKLIIFNK